jgi:putative MFS transporter
MTGEARSATAGDGPRDAAGVGARLDALPVTRLHLLVLSLCSIGFAADIAEIALSSVLAAVFMAPPHSMPRGDLSLLLASIFAGGAIGGPLLGWLADRHGRRFMLQVALAVIGLSSFAAAASDGVTAMTASRFVSGLAIGAYPPLTAAYLSELLPPSRRGALMLGCAGLAALGAPAVILLMHALSPITLGVEAWRWAVAAGGALALATAAAFVLLPESPRWLSGRGRALKADAICRRFEASPAWLAAPEAPPTRPVAATGGAPATATDEDGRPLARLAFFAGLYLLGPWATLGFPLLSAVVLVQKGFAVADSILFAGLSMLGPVLGNCAVALFIDRLDRRLALVACAAAMAALGLAFASAASLWWLVGLGLAFNLAAAVYGTILALYAAEAFPTRLRAAATGGAWSVGRLVSIAVPLALLPLATSYTPSLMFGAIAVALLASIVLVLGFGPPAPARRRVA